MSLATEVSIYTKEAASLQPSDVAAVLRLCRTEQVRKVMQFREPDRGWDMHIRALKHGIPAELGEYSYPARDIEPAELWNVLNLNVRNQVFLRYPTGWVGSFRLKTLAQIDPSIRGEFNPISISVCFGWRDILDPHRGELGWFFARSICSLTIFGYGLVANPAEFERHFLQIDEIRELYEGMAAIFGAVGLAAVPNF